jgi:hypothetical protein
MALSAAGSPLVAGGAMRDPTMDKTTSIRVERPFFYQGKRKDIGQVFDVPAALAAELITANKARRADPVVEPEPRKAKTKE